MFLKFNFIPISIVYQYFIVYYVILILRSPMRKYFYYMHSHPIQIKTKLSVDLLADVSFDFSILLTLEGSEIFFHKTFKRFIIFLVINAVFLFDIFKTVTFY